MKIVNRIGLLGLFVMLLCNTNNSMAKSKEKTKLKTSEYSGLYLGSSASTNGWGINAKYTFNNWFSLKTGYETLALSRTFDFDEADIDFEADLDYQTGGILMLADFSYAKNLYISTGVIFNSFNPEVSGMAAEGYQLGDIIIPKEDIGTFTFNVKPELKTSPYAGAGYQAFWGKRDGVVFNFETGLYYMGAPDLEIEADGLLAPTADPSFGQEAYLENQFSAYKIYPVVKLNLAVKLF